MENRKSLIVTLLLFSPLMCFSYDGETTHQALTQEAIKLFQFNYPGQKFSQAEIAAIERGSFLEDDPNTRCLDHFFDPIHNKGLYFYETSKKWANDTNGQAGLVASYNPLRGYFSSSSDYSWDRGIYEYVYGDKIRALETLGHIIHLLEDKTVPDHTRLDNHYFGSPYETWASQFTVDNIDISNNLISLRQKPILYSDLDSYFDNLAKYSNNNFFSKDTILDKNFPNPIIKQEVLVSNNIFGLGSVGNYNYKLVSVLKKNNPISGEEIVSYSLKSERDQIMFDYWNLLSKQAVLNSAGVIKLFFDKVEEEKQTHFLRDKNKSFFEKTLDSLSSKTKNLLSMVGLVANDSRLEITQTPVDLKEVLVDDPSSDKLKEAIAISEMYKILLSLEKQIKDIKGRLAEEGGSPQALAEEATSVSQQAMSLVKNSASGIKLLDEIVAEIDKDVSSSTEKQVVAPPVIVEPLNLSQVFATTTITFSGTASVGQIIYNDHSTASTSVDIDGSWSLTVSDFVDGTNTVNFFAKDLEDNVSLPTSAIFLVSIKRSSPKLTVSVNECVGAIFDKNCLTPEIKELHFSWEGDFSEGYTYFIQNRSNPGVSATTTEKSFIFNEDVYWPLDGVYQLTAYDQNGDIVSIATTSRIIIRNHLVINEIGWRGTSATDTREWMELFNNSSQDIPLEGFSIKDGSDKDLFQLSGVIPRKSYFLIERGDDSVISDVSANYVSDFSTSLVDDAISDQEFFLKLVRQTTDGERIFDNTPNGFNPQTYCKGNLECESLYQSVERVSVDDSGEDLDNWEIGPNGWANGLNSEGLEIQGTPGQLNGNSRIFQY